MWCGREEPDKTLPSVGAQGLVHKGLGVLFRSLAFSSILKSSGLWNIH